jgi:hypothetical protein
MATLTSKKPKPPAKKRIKLTFSAGDIGAWFNDPDVDGSGLEWQVQSRSTQDNERGFDLLLLNPKQKSGNHADNVRFIRWFELRADAQALATKLTNSKMTWEKALERFGPYDRDKNSAIKAHPKRRRSPQY